MGDMGIFGRLVASQQIETGDVVSMLIAAGLVFVASLLFVRERRRRAEWLAPRLSGSEMEFRRRQHRRRVIGAGLMFVCGLLFFLGGVIVKPATPRLFAAVWLSLLVVVAAMAMVALLDLMAIRRFAVGQLHRLARERASLLLAKEQAEALAKRSSSEANGNGDLPHHPS